MSGLRWGRVVLIASLALNLVVVGLLAGAWISGGGKGGPGLRGIDRAAMGLGAYVMALPDEARAQVLAAGGLAKGDRRARVRAFRQTRREMNAILQAEPFDAEALTALMDDGRGKIFETTGDLQAAFIAAFAALSPEQRAAVRARAAEMREKRRKR